MMICKFSPLIFSLFLVIVPAVPCSGAMITGGSATWTLNEGVANSIFDFNAYFDETTTRANTLSLPAPGNKPFETLSPTQVRLQDPIRPFGVSVPPGTPGASRSPQATTLDIENVSDVLGSWTASSNDYGAFVGLTSLGEQIAFTSMQRYTGPFTGVLLYGDFALRYDPTRASGSVSGLVLTSNIDFLNAAFADLGNATINVAGNQLTISGDLLISGGLTVLDPGATLGATFGTFAMTANLSSAAAVPEPSSLLLLGLGSLVMGAVYHRRRTAAGLQNTAADDVDRSVHL